MTYSPFYEAGKICALIGQDARCCPCQENSDAAREWLRGWSAGSRDRNPLAGSSGAAPPAGKTYTIQATCECERCQGRGLVLHHTWLAFRAQPHPPEFDSAEFESYWAERGYASSSLPPEEICCAACDGSGRQTIGLSLDQLRQLLAGQQARSA